MLFNSFAFAIFFPLVFILYWLLPHRKQNILLLVSSYIFYGFWDYRFLSLIAVSTIVDYITGLRIESENISPGPDSDRKKKIWLILSICTNLGLLGFFKYFNFFIDSLAGLLTAMNLNADSFRLDIVLPVGISFYTFQTMSYTIDIYRDKMKATNRIIDFAVYVAFFPQLVAGPIERAKELLPRIINKRKFDLDQFLNGVHLIFWGLFKKIYVADNLASTVTRIFSNPDPTGFEVIVGAYTFAFQIYCDFSGYSDIARGCAKCLGIELMLNFNHPYVALNPSDFWRRWHISLSSWLRDYLYIPLGGNRKGPIRTYVNLSLTMLLGGLWHGASWVFVLWGAYQGALLIGHRLVQITLEQMTRFLNVIPLQIRNLFKIIAFFQFVCIGWIIFRADSMDTITRMTRSLFFWKGQTDLSLIMPLIEFAGPLMVIELIQVLLKRDDIQNVPNINIFIKTVLYAVFFYLMVFYGAAAHSFIYFQF
ncbi:MAG: MBOAT family O-acyltransferase [Candidatus Zixiibacteriota bacterium]